MAIGDRDTVVVTTAATNIDFNANGGAVLVDLNIASSWDGTVDFQATLDGTNRFNISYITLGTLTPAISISQLSSLSTARYLLLGPLSQVRITVGAGTTGTLTAIWRTVPADWAAQVFVKEAVDNGLEVQGPVASDGVAAGNPVPLGGVVDDTSPATAAEGDIRSLRGSPEGNQLIEIYNANAAAGVQAVNLSDIDPHSGLVTLSQIYGNWTGGGQVRPVGVAQGDGDGNATGNVMLEVYSKLLEFNTSTWDRVRTHFKQTTTGITGDGAGTALNMSTTPMSKFSLVVDRTAGSTDTVEIDLELSYDNGIWFKSGATVTTLATDPNVGFSGAVEPSLYVRYRVVTVGSGNTLTVQIIAMR
jgi:hypothetical protein